MLRGQIGPLFYITHIDNLASILQRGILSHQRIDEENIPFTHVYDKEIVANRRAILTPDGRSLWNFANLYFQPRNPMLYRVLHEKSVDDIVILAVQPDIVSRSDIFISTGNAAHSRSEILPAPEGVKHIPDIRRNIDIDWWTQADGSKRRIMAECLVPGFVPADLIRMVYVASHEAATKAQAIVRPRGLHVVPDPRMFFEPFQRSHPTPHLSIVQGDMFFSRMQTLTISVNCVGVMGKGLASRAKYQFPAVYVAYQDLCRKRKLGMGKPHLYKPETSLANELADEPATLSGADAETWFLLFPTKQHWRYDSEIHGIEQGMQWLRDNYKAEGIKSLALPALGCGLGRLAWRDVGPLLCEYLSTFDVPVQIYLPAEKEIPDELLTKDFLLGQGT